MKTKKWIALSTLVILAVASTVMASVDSVTIASFSDPSNSVNNPLFVIDFENGTIDGGWNNPGLDLKLPSVDIVYKDAIFTMDQINIPSGNPAGGYLSDPGPYSIRFFHDSIEVLTIEFNRVYLLQRQSGMNASQLYGDGVNITSVDFGTLTDAQFGFNFVNTASSNPASGFQPTASFSSSAVVVPAVPEPATIAILALGGLFIKRFRK